MKKKDSLKTFTEVYNLIMAQENKQIELNLKIVPLYSDGEAKGTKHVRIVKLTA